MKKLIDELSVYSKTLVEFKKYLIRMFDFDVTAFTNNASNSTLIPQLFNFFEQEYNINILDLLVYTKYNTVERVSFNELCKKSIKVIFYKLEHKHPLDFTIF